MVLRHIVAAVLCFLLLLTHAQLWFGTGSKSSVEDLRDRVLTQQAANQVARQENDRLLSEVSDLREGHEMIEEKARSELGMVRPNEIFVQIIER